MIEVLNASFGSCGKVTGSGGLGVDARVFGERIVGARLRVDGC